MLLIRHGGLRDDANIDDINLAYKLEDGMKIHIPTAKEKEQTNNTVVTSGMEDLTQKYVTSSSGLSNVDVSSDIQSNKITKVNINVATQAQLETLPGIGPATASKIIDYRKEKGNFKKIEDIKEVSGIGDSKFEKIKEYITVK